MRRRNWDEEEGGKKGEEEGTTTFFSAKRGQLEQAFYLVLFFALRTTSAIAICVGRGPSPWP